ncbi:MAG: hypothetical protein K6T75_02635 [Acetobacteraceae bacterium]|nr:hypothetical protein [Acetobacteraceae bacterium]
MRRITLLLLASAMIVCALVAPALADRPEPATTFVLDAAGERELAVTLPDMALFAGPPGARADLGVRAVAAAFDRQGRIWYVTPNMSLHCLDGRTDRTILGPKCVNSPIYLDATGERLAFTWPDDFMGDMPLTNGVAVFDLGLQRIQVWACIPGHTLYCYGWLGDRLIVVRPWGQTADFYALSSDGGLEPLVGLQGLPVVRQFGQRSFDGHYIAYGADQGTVLVDCRRGTYCIVGGGRYPNWTAAGLNVYRQRYTGVPEPVLLEVTNP